MDSLTGGLREKLWVSFTRDNYGFVQVGQGLIECLTDGFDLLIKAVVSKRGFDSPTPILFDLQFPAALNRHAEIWGNSEVHKCMYLA